MKKLISALTSVMLIVIFTNSFTGCKKDEKTILPELKVTLPNGGNVYHERQQITVTWESQGIPLGDTISIDFDWAQGLGPNIHTKSLNDGIELINMPPDYVGQFKVIVSAKDYDVNDRSDDWFNVE